MTRTRLSLNLRRYFAASWAITFPFEPIWTPNSAGSGPIQGLEWVLVDMVVNSLKAMLVRDVMIATSNIELDQVAASEMNVSPGSYIQVELRVTGSRVGAQPAIRNIVQQAHGAVSIHDVGTEGVTVEILLPRISKDELPDRKPL